MSNIRIIFENPWWMFLLIPAVVLVLLPYFRIQRKYRRTRNRIVSLVLLMIVMLLSVSVVSGITIVYSEPNKTNEMLLLVDVSYSNGDTSRKQNEQNKNEYIKSVLDESGGIFKIGIMTFAREPHYAAPLSYDTDKVYQQYINSLGNAGSDDSATDIAAALTLAISDSQKIFSDPDGAKIIIITDGIETDGDAMAAIFAVVAKGIRVDTILFNNEYDADVQINDIILPDTNILVDVPTQLGVIVQNSLTAATNATIKFSDNNGEKSQSMEVALKANSTETFYIDNYSFSNGGLHELCFTIECEGDNNTKNNIYYSYVFLDIYERLLILEKYDGEASKLADLLKVNGDTPEKQNEQIEAGRFMDVSVKNISSDEIKKFTLRDLRTYDEVILMNIANKDFPAGFDKILQSYVREHGGGLFTIGGDELNENGDPVLEDLGGGYKQPVSHAYNREDMNTGSTVYRSLLPVNCIDYTPPLAIAIVIDCSGSMRATDGGVDTRLELAKKGAEDAVNALSERDYCTIISFSDNANIEIQLAPLNKIDKIIDAITGISYGGETKYTQPLEFARQQLESSPQVENKLILFLSDGEPQDKETYQTEAEKCADSGIRISFFKIGTELGTEVGEAMAKIGKGNFYDVKSVANLPAEMKKEVTLPQITAYNPEPFTPKASSGAQEMQGIIELPELGGFYGTKIKNGAEVILSDKYVPVYAKWKVGKGKVGSFMSGLSDISNDWGKNFLTDGSDGLKFIFNVIRALAPGEDIRATDVVAAITSKNYSTEVNVRPLIEIEEGMTTKVTVSGPSIETSTQSTVALSIDTSELFFEKVLDESFKTTYSAYAPGIYKIEIEIIDKEGYSRGYYFSYLAFSYSAEYNVFVNQDEAKIFLEKLAEKGKGAIISSTDLDGIYEGFGLVVEKSFDPRLILIIIVIILFLLDIAVRKFKWKWPHEIIRERKARKQVGHGKNFHAN